MKSVIFSIHIFYTELKTIVLLSESSLHIKNGLHELDMWLYQTKRNTSERHGNIE